MKRWVAGVMAFLICLSGCGATQEETRTLRRVVLDRGHGSMWGNQFYMDVCADEISQTRYFPSDDPGGELTEDFGRAITAEQWDEILSAVEALEPTLIPMRQPFLKKLFARKEVLDGGEFHHLTLYWAEDEAIRYEWPFNEQAVALEALLEQLALTAQVE